MEIKEKIIQTLISVADELDGLKAEWFIYGGAATILSGIDIGTTSDIDILTTSAGTGELRTALKRYMETSPKTKEDDLFRSDFVRFRLPLMEIEASGDLQIKKDGAWRDVIIREYDVLTLGGITAKVPTLSEQKRLLTLFGRAKDLRRLELLNRLT